MSEQTNNTSARELRQRTIIEAWFLRYHPLRNYPQDIKLIVDSLPSERLPTVVSNALRLIKSGRVKDKQWKAV